MVYKNMQKLSNENQKRKIFLLLVLNFVNLHALSEADTDYYTWLGGIF
jgi:hypothetical protein